MAKAVFALKTNLYQATSSAYRDDLNTTCANFNGLGTHLEAGSAAGAGREEELGSYMLDLQFTAPANDSGQPTRVA